MSGRFRYSEPLKKRVLIPLVSILGFSTIAMLDEPNEGEHTSCVVQDNQVVINIYDKDRLFSSTAFSEAGFKTWHKGQSKAHRAAFITPYFDYRPFNQDEGLLVFSSGWPQAGYYNQWQVPQTCYDAIINARFS